MKRGHYIIASVIIAAVTAGLLLLLRGSIFSGGGTEPEYPYPKRVQWYEERLHTTIWSPIQSRSSTSLPVAVDNSLSAYFPPLFTQQGNSCSQAAAIRYMFTYEMNRILDRPADSDENVFSYFWTWNFLNDGGNNGSWGEYGLRILRGAGAMSLADFPDQKTVGEYRWEHGYDKYYRAMHYRAKDILTIDARSQDDVAEMKHYLCDKGDGRTGGGMMVIYTYSSDWKVDNHYPGASSTGYSAVLTRTGTKGAHALVLVGYDDLVECPGPDGGSTRGAFIAVNPLGTKTNSDNGRIYIPYCLFAADRPNEVLSHKAVGVTAEYSKPQVVFKLRLTSNARKEIAAIMGVADKPYAELPSIYSQSTILTRQGGEHNMQGAGNRPAEIELALDFSGKVPEYASYDQPKYFINLVKYDEGEASIDHFSVLDYRTDPDNPVEYVCREIDNTPLKKGANYFSVATTEVETTSASPYYWHDNITHSYGTSSYIIRTADGRYAKIVFSNYNEESGRAEIKYVFQPDGSADFDTQ